MTGSPPQPLAAYYHEGGGASTADESAVKAAVSDSALLISVRSPEFVGDGLADTLHLRWHALDTELRERPPCALLLAELTAIV